MSIITTGTFAGMNTTVAKAALQDAQLALIALQSGKSTVSLSYAQGDGSKSVTRKIGSVAECQALIEQLQIALGLRCRTRRPMGFIRR